MANHRRHSAQLVLICILSLLVGQAVAAGQAGGGIGWGETRSESVRSAGDRVHATLIESVAGELRVGLGGAGGSRTAGGAECSWNVRVLPALEEIHLWETAPSEGAIPVQIRCGDAIVTDRWVEVADIRDVDAEASAAAQRYVETVLAPSLSLGSSPPENVLVGLDTWFWLDGWDGTPRRTTVTAPWGDSIELELSLIDVEWGFGDGSPTLRGGLGEPYPAESSIRHLYEVRSTSRHSPDGAYHLTATVHIAVRYWYDGDGPFSVPSLSTTHLAPVVVRQVQSVLH